MEAVAGYGMSADRRVRSCSGEHHTMERQNYSIAVAGCRCMATCTSSGTSELWSEARDLTHCSNLQFHHQLHFQRFCYFANRFPVDDSSRCRSAATGGWSTSSARDDTVAVAADGYRLLASEVENQLF